MFEIFFRYNSGMRKYIIFLVVFCTVFSQGICIAAVDKPVRFDRFSMEQGLSDQTVFCICEDRRGFMWFGTADGLNRFDGYKFKIYRHIPENPGSINDNIVRALLVDNEGTLWVGTRLGLNRYDRETDTFTHYYADTSTKGGGTVNHVYSLYQASSGELCLGTAQGLVLFDPGHERFIYQPMRASGNQRNIDDLYTVETIAGGQPGELWLGTINGITRFDIVNRTYRFFPVPPDSKVNLQLIHSIVKDGDIYWLGTQGAAVVRFDPEDGSYRSFLARPELPGGYSHNDVSRVFIDRGGTFWFTTYGGGAGYFNRETGAFTTFLNHPGDSKSLSGNYIYDIYQDRLGNIWIGTRGAGINKYDPKTHFFSLFRTNPDNPNSLSHNRVMRMIEDHKGILWFGLDGTGVDRYNPRTGQFKNYRVRTGNNGEILKTSINNNYVVSMIEDSRNRLWFGTWEGGINILDRNTGIFNRITHDPAKPRGLSGNIIVEILEDRRGRFWVGTSTHGLNLSEPGNPGFTHFIYNPDEPEKNSHGLKSKWVTALHEDSDGIIWVGTFLGGLYRFDEQARSFIHYPMMKKNNPKQLESIMALYDDSSSRFWVATTSRGLLLINRSNGAIIHGYGKDEGLPSDHIMGILEDNGGRLWVSSPDGLSCFDPGDGIIRNFDTFDGLQGNEFTHKSYLRTRDGTMYFSGTNGMNSFQPDSIQSNPNVPPIVITDFKIFNKSVSPGTDSPLKRQISETQKLVLSHRQNSISFEFAALNFTYPVKNQYVYMLEGFDQDWIATGSDNRNAVYTNLDGGQYRFHVKGSNNDGVWNQQGVTIDIMIKPPFWQIWWFQLAVLAALTAAFVFLYKSRVKHVGLKTELKTAHDAQMFIMPQHSPKTEGIDIYGMCRPAYSVGGDFFDYIELEGKKKKLNVAVGDVSGKAMNSAMTAVMTSGMVHSKASDTTSVSEIMTHLNQMVHLKTSKNVFTALCLSSFDIKKQQMVFTNAGLPEPVLKRENSTSFLKSEGSRLPLGAAKETQYNERKLALKKGDTIVFYTDGVTEALSPDGQYYGTMNLANLLVESVANHLSSKEVVKAIVDDVLNFSEGVAQHDDITVVVVKI